MIVLHIGMPKAGSTTIQTFFSESKDALRDLSICYPVAGRGRFKMHQHLVDELNGRPQTSDPDAGSIERLLEEIQESHCSINVISAEMLSRIRRKKIERLHQALVRSGQEFRIVLVIRDLALQIPSSYGQKIRYGKQDVDFDTFFVSRLAEWWTSPFAVAEQWAQVFGWGKMHVRLCDPNHLLGGDLVDDFLSTIGLDAKRSEITALPRQERVNESSGWKTLEAGRAMFSDRHGLPADHSLVKALQATRVGPEGRRRMRDVKTIVATGANVAQEMGWTLDKGRYLTRAQAQACADVFGKAGRQLNAHLGESLPVPADPKSLDIREREFLPDVRHIPVDELKFYYDELGARLTGVS